MKKFCNQNGFTLVECMVSVTILTVILGAVLAYLFMTLNTYKQEAENNNVNLDGRTMLAIMTNELRDAYDINFVDSQGNDKYGKVTYSKKYDDATKTFSDDRAISAGELPWSGGKYKNITLIFTQKYKSNDPGNSYIIDIELTLDNSKFTTSVFPLNQGIQEGGN